eukprot:scaffold11986_cov127-Isochrysis_galbana.AAC.2
MQSRGAAGASGATVGLDNEDAGATAAGGAAVAAPLTPLTSSGIKSRRQEEMYSTAGTALALVAPRSTPRHTASRVSSSARTVPPAAQTFDPSDDLVPSAVASIRATSSRKVAAAVVSRGLNGTGGNCSTTSTETTTAPCPLHLPRPRPQGTVTSRPPSSVRNDRMGSSTRPSGSSDDEPSSSQHSICR